jgi:uncharacterized protein YkwD
MRELTGAQVLAGFLLATSMLPAVAVARDLDQAVLDQINFARTRPREYARELTRVNVTYDPNARYEPDDPRDVEEAVAFLMQQAPLPPLRHNDRLADAALDHTTAQGPEGQLGHVGPRGQTLGHRLKTHGMFAGVTAENISYGYDDAAAVVRQLIVDSGVPNRGHRQNIFSRSYQAAGVGCGTHSVYGAMCVIDFAGAIVQR